MKKTILVFTLLAATPAFAKCECTRSITAYQDAAHAMHQAMDIEYSGLADVDFARGMIPHHQGALDMAKVQLQHGKDEELKELARYIITWQEVEIAAMSQWLRGRDVNWAAADASERPATQAYIQSMHAMHKDMDIDYTGNADIDFVRGMIPHHQGAIAMAAIHKKWGRDPLLNKISDDIIRSQAQEIALMEAWLAKQPDSIKNKPSKKSQKPKKKSTTHDHHSSH